MAQEISDRLEPLLFMSPPLFNLVHIILEYVGVWGLHFYFSQAKPEQLSAAGCDEAFIPLIQELCKQYMSDPTGKTINPETDTSSKFRSLVFLLKKVHAETPPGQHFCGIVFVKRRLVATLANLALALIPDLEGVIKSAALVGHGPRKGKPDLEGYEGMSFREQCEIIGRFRKHELNLLVSTSLLEEGLDIPACRLVVRYDIPETLIAHVQSRGRARHMHSQYIISVERNSPTTVAFLQQLTSMETSMRSLRRDPNKVVDNEQILEDVPIQYVVPTTKAVLTYPSSLEKLHQFCTSLPTDQYTKLSPIFTLILDSMHAFQYKVTLPANCAVREAEGKIHRQKLVAKQSAAFYACIQLFEAGLLNNHLLPPKPSNVFKLEDPQSKLGSKKSVREYNIGLPAMFSQPFLYSDQPTTSFFTEIYISGIARFTETRFGLISRSQIPPIEFKVRINGEERFVVFRNSAELQITPEQYTDAHMFHLVLFSHLNRSTLFEPAFAQMRNHQLPYLVVPLTKEGHVDWPVVALAKFPLENALDWVRKGKSMENVVIMHTVEYQRKYSVTAVRTDLTINSPLPSSKKQKSIADKMNRHFHTKCSDSYQPILEISKILSPRNIVSADHDPSLKPRTRCMLFAAPEFCNVLPFSFSLFSSALSLPSILHHFEACIFTFELTSSVLFLPSPLDPIWIQALTCSNISKKHNYQRLEFLGDSALKYLLSKHLFLTNPTMHEGLLSQTRAQLCCNRYLFEKAIDKSLFKYISANPLNVKGWNPNKSRTAQISDKTIADCVESLIGASFDMAKETRAQELNALYTAVAFGFKIVHESYPEILTTLLAQQQKDQHHLALGRFAKHVLGYEFKYPSLLISSFTHASKVNPLGECYQRLEFLGDAIVDLLVVRHLYQKYTTIDPGALTLLKMIMVSNKTFSLLAYYHGFYKHIEHNSATLVSTLVDFGKYVQGELLEKELTLQDISTLLDDPECDPPKILSDIFEALVAAIYLDCDMDLDRAWEVVKRLILPFMETCIHPGSHTHPVTKFSEMCQQHGCTQFTFCMEEENSGWSVKLHDYVIATVYGKNKKTAKIMAAKNAVTILTNSPGLLHEICTCQNDE